MKAKFFEKNYTLAKRICELLNDNKAEDVVLIDISNMSSIGDYFVIATANSTVHNKALVDKIEELGESLGQKVIRRDGITDGRWLVLDYGVVVVHLFTPELREYYHLDKMWNDGKNALNFAGISKLPEIIEQEIKQENQNSEN